jgi:hypothetical protein
MRRTAEPCSVEVRDYYVGAAFFPALFCEFLAALVGWQERKPGRQSLGASSRNSKATAVTLCFLREERHKG